MKLFLNRTSPYARWVLATAHEAGVAERLTLEWLEPWDDPAPLLAVNPAGKVPALLTDEGVALSESTLLCEHLAACGQGHRLLPGDPSARLDLLARLGLGRSAIDGAFGAVIGRRFNEGRDNALGTRWLNALPRIADALDAMAPASPRAEPDLGDLAVAVAFEYVTFRLPEVTWRDRPRLRDWVTWVSARPSMAATRPQ